MFFLFLILTALTSCVRIEYVNKDRIDILASADEYPTIVNIKGCNETSCVPIHRYNVEDRVIRVNTESCDAIYVSMDLYDAKGELVNTTIIKKDIPRSTLFEKLIEPGHAIMWVYVISGMLVVGCVVVFVGYREDKHKDTEMNDYIFNDELN